MRKITFFICLESELLRQEPLIYHSLQLKILQKEIPHFIILSDYALFNSRFLWKIFQHGGWIIWKTRYPKIEKLLKHFQKQSLAEALLP